MTIKQDNDTVGSFSLLKKTNIHFLSTELNETPEAGAHVGGLKTSRRMWRFHLRGGRGKAGAERRHAAWVQLIPL